jgi:archaellum component FlaC
LRLIEPNSKEVSYLKEPSIRKADLLVKLNEIYTQLEELETVLHSTYLNQQHVIKKIKKEGLDIVEERLDEFEADIDKLSLENHPHNKSSAYSKLELGLENL